MSALERVRAGGRSLDRRLDAVSGQALLAGLRAAGAVSEPEAAALGPPASSGWTRRLRALAAAKGDRTCRVLLTVLEGLEGPPRPGPFDFYNPERDAVAGHRSDCPCCRPEPEWTREEEEEPKTGDEGHEDEEPKIGDEGHEDDEEPKNEDEGHEDDEEPKNEDECHEDEDEEPKNEDEGHEDDEEPKIGDEGHEDEEPKIGDEGHEDEDEEPKIGDEGPEDEDEEPKNEDEGPEDEEDGGDED